jgi:hypothetical protein
MLQGLLLMLSGASALFGGVFLIYYGIRLVIGQAKDRKMEAPTRARILAIIAIAYGIATIAGVGVEGASGPHTIWLATAVVAGVRSWTWRRRLQLDQAH